MSYFFTECFCCRIWNLTTVNIDFGWVKVNPHLHLFANDALARKAFLCALNLLKQNDCTYQYSSCTVKVRWSIFGAKLLHPFPFKERNGRILWCTVLTIFVHQLTVRKVQEIIFSYVYYTAIILDFYHCVRYTASIRFLVVWLYIILHVLGCHFVRFGLLA